MQFINSQISRLDKNYGIINLDASRASVLFLLFAVASFFMHLMLHNYNNFKDNTYKKEDYSSMPLKSISSAIKKDIPEKIITTNTTPQTYPQYNFSKLQNDEQIIASDVKLATVKNKLNVKKLGNITVISMQGGNTLSEALSASGIINTKSYLMATAVSKKYKLSKIQTGDILQIIKLSNDKSKNDNIKIIIAQKTEILIKGNTTKYDVLVRNIENHLKKKVDIFSANQSVVSKVQPNLIQKLKFNSNNIISSNVTSDLKRDLLQIMHMIKQDSKFKNGSVNINVLYEKLSSKISNLFYVELQSANAKVRVYKYKDKAGAIQYIKNNGVILTRNQRIQTTPTSSFRISYPVDRPVISSAFGMRFHPLTGKHKMHKGIDFTASRGTPIHAPADGIIVEMTNGKGYGKYIRVRHNSTYTTLYAHLDKFSNKTVGNKISKGDVIGYIGNSGRTSGAHLHFELHENGRAINPVRLISNMPILNPGNLVKQLNSKQMRAFNAYKSSIDKKVGSL